MGGFGGRLIATTRTTASATHDRVNARTKANVGNGSGERLANVTALKRDMAMPPIMPCLTFSFRIGIPLPRARSNGPGRSSMLPDMETVKCRVGLLTGHDHQEAQVLRVSPVDAAEFIRGLRRARSTRRAMTWPQP